jgi:hypothetical protein
MTQRHAGPQTSIRARRAHSWWSRVEAVARHSAPLSGALREDTMLSRPRVRVAIVAVGLVAIVTVALAGWYAVGTSRFQSGSASPSATEFAAATSRPTPPPLSVTPTPRLLTYEVRSAPPGGPATRGTGCDGCADRCGRVRRRSSGVVFPGDTGCPRRLARSAGRCPRHGALTPSRGRGRRTAAQLAALAIVAAVTAGGLFVIVQRVVGPASRPRPYRGPSPAPPSPATTTASLRSGRASRYCAGRTAWPKPGR